MNFAPRVFLLLTFLILSPLHFLQAQTAKLHDLAEQLRAIDTGGKRNSSGDVPPAAQKLLPQFKAGLREIVGRTLNEHSSSSPEALHKQILAGLKKEGIDVLNSAQRDGYYTADGDDFGSLYDVTVRQPARHSDLMAVVTNLTIPCGSDASLSLYRRDGVAWQLILVEESNGYKDISGGQGSFQFGISPPDADGNWYLVTADVNPWCSSNWQQLRYKVLRPGEDATHPSVLLDERTSIYLGTDLPYKLTLSPQGFELHIVAAQGLDDSILTREHVQNYEVSGSRVTRIPPLALAPEDFLDEWVGMKWEDASTWTSSADAARFQHWHDRLSRDSREKIDTEFDFVQPCKASDKTAKWQIGLQLEGAGEHDLPGDVPAELFFTISKRESTFYVESVDKERPPGCPGNTLPRGAREALP
ncbi:MAG TPA: hypothetical protein VJO16_09420 [Candidatus Acidoferrum sp.]|nr:hypothetical protein [Candidatus Acidoferrum sp.]